MRLYQQPTFFYTSDSDGNRIDQSATIYAVEAATEAEALEKIKKELIWNGVAEDEVEVIAGDFGDCWIKLFKEPDADTLNSLSPFSADDLIVQNPGSHPGGKAWWVTPLAPVYVLAHKDAAQ
jgi:hypothetical protein